jgi:Terpene synthase family 2, C-terminal metal binding
MDVDIPHLYCPFASRISPHAEALEATNLAWIDLVKLVPNARVVERAQFGRLAARAYPEASLDTLAIAAAWATWLFLRDDQCDEGGISSDPKAMRALADHQIDVLAGQRPHRGDDALTAALVDLRERMLVRGGGKWMARFLANVQDYFDAVVWEAENRALRRVPDVTTYVRLRDMTGAVRTCFDIFELAVGPLAIEARCDSRLVRLMSLANRAICWSNDLFSIEKELTHGDVHNLAIVLHRETDISLQDAVAAAARMHDDVVRSFEHHAALVAPEQRYFVDALAGWIRANVDWSIETGRYGRAKVANSASLRG